MGKMLLAIADDPAAEVAALGTLQRFTERTVTEPLLLVAELEAIRGRGWSLNDGERDPGVRAIAVAVPHAGGPAAAVAVQGPDVRLPDERLASVVALLDSTVAAGSTSSIS
jgi:IclR family acetate operon transcriptional repressor